MYIGNHLSASKGYAAMGRAAVGLGANTFAFSPGIPEAGRRKRLTPRMSRHIFGLQRSSSSVPWSRMRPTR